MGGAEGDRQAVARARAGQGVWRAVLCGGDLQAGAGLPGLCAAAAAREADRVHRELQHGHATAVLPGLLPRSRHVHHGRAPDDFAAPVLPPLLRHGHAVARRDRHGRVPQGTAAVERGAAEGDRGRDRQPHGDRRPAPAGPHVVLAHHLERPAADCARALLSLHHAWPVDLRRPRRDAHDDPDKRVDGHAHEDAAEDADGEQGPPHQAHGRGALRHQGYQAVRLGRVVPAQDLWRAREGACDVARGGVLRCGADVHVDGHAVHCVPGHVRLLCARAKGDPHVRESLCEPLALQPAPVPARNAAAGDHVHRRGLGRRHAPARVPAQRRARPRRDRAPRRAQAGGRRQRAQRRRHGAQRGRGRGRRRRLCVESVGHNGDAAQA
eukprot:Unigene9286_Nuclearia_a/m.28357 Unigene9286_Nuclearia_a/g.28357  ORF Unigene9286_Nuclearia_a/g.28357 Unigene9286_Nuclearia_a/m.28357 type:complete len:381 (+) Unigene9286_Nuclearia_a:826-1968(+)